MEMKLGICQLQVTRDKKGNLQKAAEQIKQAVAGGAQMVVLPEMFNCPYQKDVFYSYAETVPEGETVALLADLARQYQCYIVGGSIPELDGKRLYNSSLVFDCQGQLIARHRKIHLFDIELPGKIAFKESAVLSPGSQVTCFDTQYGRFGVAICYDMRFPELFRLMVDAGVQAVVVPAAFNMTTGPAHWEVLLRARAIDNQIHLAAVSPARDIQADYVAYGHSLAVDPWGTIIWEADAAEQVKVITLDMEKNREVRQGLPVLAHRRSDLYRVASQNASLSRG